MEPTCRKARHVKRFPALWIVLFAGLLVLTGWHAGGLAASRPEQQQTLQGSADEFNPRLGTFYYRIKWGVTKVSEATITVKRDGEFYRIIADQKTTKNIDWIYRVRYRGETRLSTAELAPLETVVTEKTRKKKQTLEARYTEDGKAEATVTKEKKGQPPTAKTYLIESETFSIDIFAGIFFARSFHWQKGESQQFEIFTGKDRFWVTLDCIGEALVEEGSHKIKAWVIRPSARKIGSSKKKSVTGKTKLYLSADESRDVLKIKTRLRFGDFVLKLKHFQPE